MTRAVKDEKDLTSYCLNCISKHTGMAHLLLKEVENRIQTNEKNLEKAINDNTIKRKMKEVMENLAHIEDHTMINRIVTPDEKFLLDDIAIRANQVRGRLKSQKWDNLSPRSKTSGDIGDIQWMKIAMWDIHKVNDEGKVDFGCGDCGIEFPKLNITTSINKTPINFEQYKDI